MKKIITLLLILLPVFCMGQTKKDKQAAMVKEAVESGCVYVHVEQVVPLSMRMKDVSTDSYSFKLNDGKLTCYLPYIGTSQTAIMGSDDTGIKAEALPVSMNKVFNAKKKCWWLTFNFENVNLHEQINCRVQIFTNGQTYIRMQPAGRDSIQYQGEVEKQDNNNN
jgi:rRNA maturation protein Rpf1